MRKPEVLFFIAVLVGVIVGKLIKNFKFGLLAGVAVATIYVFVSRPARRKK